METSSATRCLAALAHDGRLGLIRSLVQAGPQGMRMGDLARLCGLQLTTASAQLTVLANAGLVAFARQGREVHYRADFDRIEGLVAFLMQDCCRPQGKTDAPCC